MKIRKLDNRGKEGNNTVNNNLKISIPVYKLTEKMENKKKLNENMGYQRI